MQWMTAQQAAEKWGVSLRYVQRLLASGRVPHAKKHEGLWMLPLQAEKPTILAKKERSERTILPYLVCMWDYPLAEDGVEKIWQNLESPELHSQYLAEVAYLRGDFLQSKHFAAVAYKNPLTRICAALDLMVIAVGTNDFPLYREVEYSLQQQVEHASDKQEVALAEMVLAAMAVSMFAPKLVSEWVKEGDFSRLPAEAISFALYIEVKYLQNIADFQQMLAVSQTVLTLKRGMNTVMAMYMLIMCAVAQVGLGRKEKGRQYLLEALALGMPCGFITPFVENVSTLGGLVEECVQTHYAYAYRGLLEQWQISWKNWAVFHNHFTQDKISLLLTRREIRIANLAASRVPYAQIAQEERISVGRVRNIIQDIYGKLFVCNREELAERVLWLPKKT